MAKAYTNIGSNYAKMYDLSNAMLYFQQALNIQTELNDSLEISRAYASIGNVFFLQEDFLTAIEHYTHCIQIREDMGDVSRLVGIFNNMGSSYKQIGNSKLIQTIIQN